MLDPDNADVALLMVGVNYCFATQKKEEHYKLTFKQGSRRTIEEDATEDDVIGTLEQFVAQHNFQFSMRHLVRQVRGLPHELQQELIGLVQAESDAPHLEMPWEG